MLIGIAFSSSCKYDKEIVEPIDNTPIDTSNNDTTVITNTTVSCDSIAASFSQDILPLINSKCSPCHVDGNASGGHTWTNYDEVFADKNLILSAINHEPSTSNMPQGRDKLSDENIRLVECWIENGALDN